MRQALELEEPGTGMRSRRRALTSAGVLAVVAATCGALASRRLLDSPAQSAQVVAVTAVSRQVASPHEVCKSEEVSHVRPELDAREAPGKRKGGDASEDDTYTTTEEHCVTVLETATERAGYEVRYRLNGREGRVHMDRAPGARILIRDGQPVAEPSAVAARVAGSN